MLTDYHLAQFQGFEKLESTQVQQPTMATISHLLPHGGPAVRNPLWPCVACSLSTPAATRRQDRRQVLPEREREWRQREKALIVRVIKFPPLLSIHCSFSSKTQTASWKASPDTLPSNETSQVPTVR